MELLLSVERACAHIARVCGIRDHKVACAASPAFIDRLAEQIMDAIAIACALSSRMEDVEIAQTESTAGAQTPQPTARMTREQSKANTRERLLGAARSAFASSGFHGASVEEIPSRAGFSTGALYSNFDGKEDLFLVLMEREIEEHAREIADAVRSEEHTSELQSPMYL